MKALNEKIGTLIGNEEFAKALSEAASVEEMHTLFAENGVVLTPEEMKAFIQTPMENAASDEMMEADLDAVSGGVIGTLLAMTGAAWGLACDAYGGPRAAVKGITSYWKNKLFG